MANLLTNANLQALVSIDESETVSLTTLLLSEEEQEPAYNNKTSPR